MKRILGLYLGMMLSFNVMADRVIVLKDGSRIRGEIVSVENGLYRIDSESLGTIFLGSNQIESILSASASTASEPALTVHSAVGIQSAVGTQSAMQSIQSTIMNNPGIMGTIMELQNDPQIQAVLADPEVMKAIQSFDFEALANNPRIKALMNNSKVRHIQGSLQ